jgi:hypothetical protein
MQRTERQKKYQQTYYRFRRLEHEDICWICKAHMFIKMFLYGNECITRYDKNHPDAQYSITCNCDKCERCGRFSPSVSLYEEDGNLCQLCQ